MTEDIWDDPEAKAWRERANTELRPMIENSAISVVLWGKPDAKLAVEVGFTLLLGKPFVVLKPSGQDVPASLARLADAIVEYDDITDPTVMRRVAAEAKRILEGP